VGEGERNTERVRVRKGERESCKTDGVS